MVSTEDRDFFRCLFSKLSLAFADAAAAFDSENSSDTTSQNTRQPHDILLAPEGSVSSEVDPLFDCCDDTSDRSGGLLTGSGIVSDSIGPNYHNMKRADLQELCKSRHLRATGKTWQIIERLVAFDTPEPKVCVEYLTLILFVHFIVRYYS